VGDATLVDPSIGTGVVKVTPAHDFNDYECGVRHGLEIVNVMNDDGTLNENARECGVEGMKRFEARRNILISLKSNGNYRGETDHKTSISRCSRSGDVLEPVLKPQWFLNCKTMAKQSIGMVCDSESRHNIGLSPELYRGDWVRWLDNIEDWCVSRQLWWGHRVPAYAVNFEDGSQQDNIGKERTWVIARDEEEAREKVKSNGKTFTLKQDEDVLDTWFSSALLPLSALGWSGQEEHFESPHYPLSVMETGSDILFFWVARMSMLCTALQSNGGLPSEQLPPFKQIFLHPMVRDKTGRKMSKSLGNVIDPLHVIHGVSLSTLLKELEEGNLGRKEIVRAKAQVKKEFPAGIEAMGPDALRFALSMYMKQGREINLDINTVKVARNLCNKMWQVSKFVLSHAKSVQTGTCEDAKIVASSLPCKWIMGRLASTIERCNHGFEHFDLALSADAIRSFFLDDFCGVFVETAKAQTSADQIAENAGVLLVCLRNILLMFHPFMPFITEELWGVVNQGASESIMVSKFPCADYFSSSADPSVGRQMDYLLSVAGSTRKLKFIASQLGVNTKESKFSLVLKKNSKNWATIKENIHCVAVLSHVSEFHFFSNENSSSCNPIVEENEKIIELQVDESTSVSLIFDASEDIVMKKAGAEIVRLQRQLEKIRKQISKINKRQSKEQYKLHTPLDIKERDLAKLHELSLKVKNLTQTVETLTNFYERTRQ
jgi:valyl-tRNA synthetase